MPRLLPSTSASAPLACPVSAVERSRASYRSSALSVRGSSPGARGSLVGGVAGTLLALTLGFGASACTSATLDSGEASAESKVEPAADSLDRTLRDSVTKTAICVQPERYAVSDELVIDRNEGGKSWQRKVQADVLAHDDAASFCASLKVAGQGEFRLPTASELQGLLLKPGRLHVGEEGFCSPAIDQVAFPETPADWFWSSDVRSQGDAVYTDFADGRTHSVDPNEHLFVRCVRERD